MVQTCGLTQFPPFPILSSFSTYLAFAFSLSPPFPLSQEVIPSHGTSKMRVNIQHIVAQKTNTHKKRTTLDSISPIFSLKLANPSPPLLGRPDFNSHGLPSVGLSRKGLPLPLRNRGERKGGSSGGFGGFFNSLRPPPSASNAITIHSQPPEGKKRREGGSAEEKATTNQLPSCNFLRVLLQKKGR